MSDNTSDPFAEAIKDFPIDDLTRNSLIWIAQQDRTASYERGRREGVNIKKICEEMGADFYQIRAFKDNEEVWVSNVLSTNIILTPLSPDNTK